MEVGSHWLKPENSYSPSPSSIYEVLVVLYCHGVGPHPCNQNKTNNQIVSLKCVIDLNTILYIVAVVENMATRLGSVMYEKPNRA